MTNWLSNKWNLIGLYALCSFCIGYILYAHGLTFTELLIVYLLMSVLSIVVYILGIGRGMVLYALRKKEFDKFIDVFVKGKEDK